MALNSLPPLSPTSLSILRSPPPPAQPTLPPFMAKGRKLTTSRSERFLGTYANGYSHHSAVADSSELREEDIWSMEEDGGTNVTNGEWEPHAEINGGSISVRSRHRISGEPHRQVGGLSLAFEDPAINGTMTPATRIVHQFRSQNDGVASPRVRHVTSSLPVNVPDWSKILRVDSVGSFHEGDDDDFDEEESDMVPPHEYLARSRNAAANSVFEGVGRTLKGRDMSRVRDAVWSQTGFNG
ncbi:hypothetical protein TanjilG_00598 [Lupinus angustifolius]|uniref:Senescence regulator S40 n=1 Tax=Lupinus angustifolius TaxID=3871 RepID=A0A1J7GUY9_LUPAN|nr:PREDICTED: uncharacterized protein LOC109334883 [Lupinus angustifolius]OIV91930.1 hypothetical protein TanjilG_00598 [Lupinus angustifolius]